MNSVAPFAALMLAVTLGACSTAPQRPVGPTRSTGLPYPVNNREVETVNSLPPGFTTDNPIAPPTGVLNQTRAP